MWLSPSHTTYMVRPRRASVSHRDGLNGLQPYIRAVFAGLLLPIVAIRSQGSYLGNVLEYEWCVGVSLTRFDLHAIT